jgi:hypothetical protein
VRSVTQLLQRARNAADKTQDTSTLLPLQTLSKGVYALGSLLRKCAEAQAEFIATGGDELVNSLLTTAHSGTCGLGKTAQI